MKHEMERLQVAVDLLHAYLAAIGTDDRSRAPQAQQHITTLCVRLPSLQSELQGPNAASQLSLVAKARQKLNALQSQINKRRQQDAVRGQRQD